jgi:hypothetical protein
MLEAALVANLDDDTIHIELNRSIHYPITCSIHPLYAFERRVEGAAPGNASMIEKMNRDLRDSRPSMLRHICPLLNLHLPNILWLKSPRGNRLRSARTGCKHQPKE